MGFEAYTGEVPSAVARGASSTAPTRWHAQGTNPSAAPGTGCTSNTAAHRRFCPRAGASHTHARRCVPRSPHTCNAAAAPSARSRPCCRFGCGSRAPKCLYAAFRLSNIRAQNATMSAFQIDGGGTPAQPLGMVRFFAISATLQSLCPDGPKSSRCRPAPAEARTGRIRAANDSQVASHRVGLAQHGAGPRHPEICPTDSLVTC